MGVFDDASYLGDEDSDEGSTNGAPNGVNGTPRKSTSNPFSSVSEGAKSIREKLHIPSFGSGDILFARRFTTVAQGVFAPCMAPNLSTILANGTSSPTKQAHLSDVESSFHTIQNQTTNKANDSMVSEMFTSNLVS